MSEHPILFSAPMVQAILNGRKTQTRRVLRLPVTQEPDPGEAFGLRSDGAWAIRGARYAEGLWTPEFLSVRCPYGVAGDRLWVRETWRETGQAMQDDGHIPTNDDGLGTDCVRYRADEPWESPWRPSIFMPRWASRLTLEVVSVRVERLQAITEEDARAEGAGGLPVRGTLNGEPMTGMVFDPAMAFRMLWDSINGKRPGCRWEDSPWVWAVTFRRLP